MESRTMGIHFETLPKVKVISQFWSNLRQLVVEEVLFNQWSIMNDEQDVQIPQDPSGNTFEQSKSHAVRNLQIAAGQLEGKHYGFPFQDSDLFKWLEATAYSLMYGHNQDLRDKADYLVNLMALAQEDDGYLDSAFQLGGRPQWRWKLLQRSHELYTMGHCIEGTVAYHEATGNATALKIACGVADCIAEHFGPQEGKIHGVDGHPEIEVALPRLYQLTGERRYLDLAQYFLQERGRNPAFFDEQNEAMPEASDFMESMDALPRSYYQIDKPFIEQQSAEGHAVRVSYLCAGAAHVAALTGERTLCDVAKRLWADITHRRMYITGQIGSSHIGESFTTDFDLPNDTMYGESCASVAMCFFARRMLELEPQGEYGDILEKELFNGAISGMSLDGRHFFYVNPLEADPIVCAENPDRRHVLTHRADWFGCACCPANITRLVASVDRYIYTIRQSKDVPTIYSHQFIANEADFGQGVHVRQTNDFPWEGHIEYDIENPEQAEFHFAVRIPSWSADSFTVRLNGKPLDCMQQDGFIAIDIRPDCRHTDLTIDLDMSIKPMAADPRIRSDAGKVAFMRGPVVFCVESADNPESLWRYSIAVDKSFAGTERFEAELLGGVETLTLRAKLTEQWSDTDMPYCQMGANTDVTPANMKLIPYFRWANRQNGQMAVWLQRG